MRTPAEIRRAKLQAIVDRDGLAAASKRFGKPDRQINDMLAMRKSFGEKVARAMEEKYDPNLPAGWLDADDDSKPPSGDMVFCIEEVTTEDMISALATRLSSKSSTVLEYAVAKIRMVFDLEKERRDQKANDAPRPRRGVNQAVGDWGSNEAPPDERHINGGRR